MLLTLYSVFLILFVSQAKSEDMTPKTTMTTKAQMTLEKGPYFCHEVSDKYMSRNKIPWLVFLLFVDCSDDIDLNQRSADSKCVTFSDNTEIHHYPLEHQIFLESKIYVCEFR